MTHALIPVSSARQHSAHDETLRPSQTRGFAACAAYAYHAQATRFAVNRLTGRAQSLTDLTGWLLDEKA